MIYGYCRVSTRGQARDGNGLEVQESELHKAGAEVIFSDSYTGTEISRPELDKLLLLLSDGDTLMVTKLDRIARTARDGLEFVESLISRGVKIYILDMGLMDNTPMSKVTRQIFFAFAEFERNTIVERMQAGKTVARQTPDYREGRPKKYGAKQISHAMELLVSHTYREVEQMTGISKSTLIRARRETAL